jgi:osmoprotectant transport system ATP-binding protein
MNADARNSLVRFHNVTFSLPSPSEKAITIISDLNLTVERGEILVLLGESGCGKTTTLKLVNRLLTPSSGEVLVEDKPTTAWDPIALRRRIGYVIQEGGLFPHFTIARNVGLVPSLSGWDRERTSERVHELLLLWVSIRIGLRSAIRTNCQVDSGSAPASPVHWPRIRRCFCLTSHLARWIH